VHIVYWETLREGHLPIRSHAALANLFRTAYPHHARLFAEAKSWSYVRPELRVIGWEEEDRPVASAGILRRFIEVDGNDQLVAIVGLVAVYPAHQGTGLGLTLMNLVADALACLGVPFGLLMCEPRRVSFYQRAGWYQLSPRRVLYSHDDTSQPRAFIDEIVETAMVLPVTATLRDWPNGDMNWHGASV
jgi:nodulation protein A